MAHDDCDRKIRHTLAADDREPESVVSALRSLRRVQVSLRRLKLGDYVVDGRLLIERKTLPDFALSIVQGRLFRQAEEHP